MFFYSYQVLRVQVQSENDRQFIKMLGRRYEVNSVVSTGLLAKLVLC